MYPRAAYVVEDDLGLTLLPPLLMWLRSQAYIPPCWVLLLGVCGRSSGKCPVLGGRVEKTPFSRYICSICYFRPCKEDKHREINLGCCLREKCLGEAKACPCGAHCASGPGITQILYLSSGT